MKSMLYVGATLMIGASIYGFVDYKQTSEKKEFTNMYEHKEVKDPVVKEEKNVAVVEPVAEKKEVVAKVKKANTTGKKNVAANNVTVDEVIPAIKPISEEARIANKEIKTIEKTTVDVKTSKTVVVKKKKKKLNHKIFSRAPLREEEETVVLDLEKDSKKIEKKEQ